MRRVLVHGFTQTAASWEGVLDGDAVDVQPNVDLPTTAAWLTRTAGEADYVGYSMGGRLCLHAALAEPHFVRRLVLLGAHPGLADATERAARRAADEALAASIERDGVDAFLDRWLAHPRFAGLADPGPRCRHPGTLAACLRRLGLGTQDPLWERLGDLAMPVLVLAGGRDATYVGIGRRTAAAIGANARFEAVPDAGHPAHLEAPESFRALVDPFLD